MDGAEVTLRIWQEIYDEAGKLIEIPDKYRADKRASQNRAMTTTRETIAATLRSYLRH